ncbi:MAG: acyl carrier protein [Bacteroidales bacterium]|nr:acyl carrier protein [Bacteroidales bacterium]
MKKIDNIFEEVQKILAKQLRIPADKVQMDSRIRKDLGADSLTILQLLLKIEDEYDIRIPDEELANFGTVGDVVAFLEKLSSKKR